jgi:hypothetical protein
MSSSTGLTVPGIESAWGGFFFVSDVVGPFTPLHELSSWLRLAAEMCSTD